VNFAPKPIVRSVEIKRGYFQRVLLGNVVKFVRFAIGSFTLKKLLKIIERIY